MKPFCSGRLALPANLLLILLLALLVVPASSAIGQEDGADTRAIALQKKLVGSWVFDIDRVLASPEYANLQGNERALREREMRVMMAQLRLTITDTELTIGTPAGGRTVKYTVEELVGDGHLRLAVTNAETGEREAVDVVIDGDHIELWNTVNPEQKSFFQRDTEDGNEPVQDDDPPSMNDDPNDNGDADGDANAARIKKLVVGEWTINIERSVRENPDNQGLSEDELKAQIEQGKMMAGMVTIEITAEAMTIVMGEMRMESPWKILSVDGNTLEAEVNANGEIRKQKVEVINDNTLRMHVQGQMLIVIRKGATPDVGPAPETTEPYTGPAPEGMHRLMIGEWQVDLEQTLRADPALKNVSEDEFQAALGFARMAAGDMKVVVRPDRMDVHRMGSVEKYAYKVVMTDGNKVKIVMTSPDGKEQEAIFTVEPTKMNGAVAGRPTFLTRDKAPDMSGNGGSEATPAPGPATADQLRGIWVVDIDATVNNDPRFKDLSDERKKQIAQGLAGFLGAVSWTFTNDRFVEDTPAGKRDYAYKVVKVDGQQITIEMSDDAGNSAQTTLTMNGTDKLSGDIHGSMRWLKRKPTE